MKTAPTIMASALVLLIAGVCGFAQASAFCDPNEKVCIGQPCDLANVGMTVLDYDDVNLLACLKSTTAPGTGVWKPMTGTALTCPNGELVSGLDHGQPICSSLSCRIVSSQGSPPSYISTATCSSGEFVLNGGGYTHADQCGYLGFLHISMPVENGWKVDAWGTNSPWAMNSHSDVCSTAYVTCCKWVAAPKP